MISGISKLVVAGVLAALAVVIFASMYIFGWGMFQRATADFRGETAAIERIEADGDYRIAVYNEFFDRCASIQSFEDRIRILETELEGDPTPDRKTQIQQALGAIKAQRAEEVRQYNVDTNKDFTAGQFRDLDLPFEINIEGNNTECVASSS